MSWLSLLRRCGARAWRFRRTRRRIEHSGRWHSRFSPATFATSTARAVGGENSWRGISMSGANRRLGLTRQKATWRRLSCFGGRPRSRSLSEMCSHSSVRDSRSSKRPRFWVSPRPPSQNGERERRRGYGGTCVGEGKSPMSDDPVSDDPELQRLLTQLGVTPAPGQSDGGGAAAGDAQAAALWREVILRAMMPPDRAVTGTRRELRRLRAGVAAAVLVATALIGFGATIWLTLAPTDGPPADPSAGELPALAYQGHAGDGDAVLARLPRLLSSADEGSIPATTPVAHTVGYRWTTSASRGTAGKDVLRVEAFAFPDGRIQVSQEVGAYLDTVGHLAGLARADLGTRTWSPYRASRIEGRVPPSSGRHILGALASLGGCHAVDATCVFGGIERLMLHTVPEDDLTQRIWMALATMPGITSRGKTTDRLGRDADSLVAVNSDGTRTVLLVDPSTGSVLGTEHESRSRQVTSFVVLATSEWVAENDVPDDVLP